MKLELKPGVSPAYFWTSIAIGLGGTAATALSLTAYAWAATAAALIALVIGFVRGNVKPPPGAASLLLAAFCLSCVGCSSYTREDAKRAGTQIGLAAADTAILIARMQLASAESELSAAATQPGADRRVILAKQLAVIAARRALDEAERAIARQRAKTNAKQPHNVQPSASADDADSEVILEGPEPTAPACEEPRITVPRYGVQVAASLR